MENILSLSATVGFAISLILERAPWISERFEPVSPSGKRIIVSLLSIVGAVVLSLVYCEVWEATEYCISNWNAVWVGLLNSVIAIVSSQGGHGIFKKDN